MILLFILKRAAPRAPPGARRRRRRRGRRRGNRGFHSLLWRGRRRPRRARVAVDCRWTGFKLIIQDLAYLYKLASSPRQIDDNQR